MMDAQVHNLCLLNMPELVLNKILSNIHNPSNVSRTCKYLCEIVCGMEKRRRVMYISASDAKSPLNIDTDAVFVSIMNTHRTIKEMELRVDFWGYNSYELNERQLGRLSAIMKQFGANVASLKFHGFELPINFIRQMLQETAKLEWLSFTCGKVSGSATTTMSLQLSCLKALEIEKFTGILDFVNLIPAGSLNSIRYTNQLTESPEVLPTILTKQRNVKSLTFELCGNSDLLAICVDHLQLETLIVRSSIFHDNSLFLDLVKCQPKLKELKCFSLHGLSFSAFQWICNNLKKLEVLEVHRVDSIEGNACEMLGELKKLRHFRTFDADYLFADGFRSSQFKSGSIEQFVIGHRPEFHCGELLTKMVNSMAHNFPNLTHLQMKFENFSALCFVLGHCKKIINLSTNIRDLNPEQLTQQRFPNIQSLELCHLNQLMMSEIMSSIVCAMPNLKSMLLSTRFGITFDLETMNEFIRDSKSLDYFYVNRFELHEKLPADDVVEIIRYLASQLKGYHINFSASTSPEHFFWHKIKDILCNVFYVRDYSRNPSAFYLQKGGRNPFN